MRLVWLSLSVLVVAAEALSGRGIVPLAPRASPQPCAQAYVCPQPVPYPNVPDTGALPGPNEFKCRIGQSGSDADFAFCYYSKDTGTLLRSTPGGIEGLCWTSGMANPQCAPGRRRTVPRRPPPVVRHEDDVPAPRVSMGRFFPRRLEPRARSRSDSS
ncbi:hypothetical protein AURDEDRAFT_168193 [Auricularia subglabra TFB-10046 SS5]|nr:hypothetical protein AURDEDRAFT_168193 [Auricularia subglabra TFB-10046 SS5]